MRHPVAFLASLVLLMGISGAPAQTTKKAPPPGGKAMAQPQARMAQQKNAPLPKAAAIPSHKELRYPPLRPIQVPNVERFTLPNGMRVFLVEAHELPLVNGFALVRTGNLFDPPDKIGLAGITGTVMRTGGTAKRTGEEIDEQLENIAASVEAGIGETSGTVSFSALKENSAEVMAVFKEILTAPEFRQDQINLARTRLESSISRRNDDASGVASREFDELIYGRDNPYGWRTEYEHLARIQREDLQTFHRRYFFPQNTILAVYGDFQTAEMKAQLEKLFASWTVQQPPVPPFPAVTSRYQPGVYLAEKDDVTQAFFGMGHLGGVLSDKDYPALEVMADILGGGFTSRLFRKVRTELGYAYGVGAGWGADYTHPGVFRITGSTKSASVTDTLRVVEQEVARLRSGLVTAEELQVAKDTVLNSFVFNFDTPSKTLSRFVRYEYFGYPQDFIFRYQKAVAAVTREDVLRVAKEYLKPEQFGIVVVGNPKDFREPLAALGKPVKMIDLTIPRPRVETAVADQATMARGRKELARIQQAVGGKTKLQAVRDATLTSQMKMTTGQGEMEARTSVRWLDGAMRQEQELPFGRITAFFDGKEGWLSTPQGSGPLPEPVKRQLAQERFRFLITLLLADECAGCQVVAAGDGVLEITSPENDTVRLLYDASSALPTGRQYQSVAMMGAPQKVEEKFLEWKEFDGVKLPVHSEVMQGGKKVIESRVADVQLNKGLQLEDLKKQP